MRLEKEGLGIPTRQKVINNRDREERKEDKMQRKGEEKEVTKDGMMVGTEGMFIRSVRKKGGG